MAMIPCEYGGGNKEILSVILGMSVNTVANTEIDVDFESLITQQLTAHPDYEFLCLFPNGTYSCGVTSTRVSSTAPKKVWVTASTAKAGYVYGILLLQKKE